MIPDNWRVTLIREGGWRGWADKAEGSRTIEVKVGCGGSPKLETPEQCLAALEQEILK